MFINNLLANIVGSIELKVGMGAFLDTPKTEKHTEKGSGNGLAYGLASMQGWRIEMEDAHCARAVLPHAFSQWSFFAVFDGHAGARVSAHCSENLIDSIIQTDEFKLSAIGSNNEIPPENVEKIKSGIRDGFLKLDEKMKTIPEVESGEDRSGSTAVCALVSPTHIFFANCGDSRAVLSRSGKAFFSTQDHKPVNPTEKERIQKAGGSVMIQRVNGSLAVSRALGDYEYKQVEGKGPCEQLVSPEPEIVVHERDNQSDEFFVLACDGIWDVMVNEELCDYVRHMLRTTNDLESICGLVIDTCLYKGSKDNMSMVLVTLPGAPRVTEEACQRDQDLNTYLERKIQEIVTEKTDVDINDVIQLLAEDDIPDLPPGGGLCAKRTMIEEIYWKLLPNTPNEFCWDQKEDSLKAEDSLKPSSL